MDAFMNRILVATAPTMVAMTNGTMGNSTAPGAVTTAYASRHPYTLPETTFEYVLNALLGLAYLAITLVSLQRMRWSRQHGGAETTVVTAFYSLILITASLRTIFFLIPASVWQPSYTPVAVMAFSSYYKSWFGLFMSEFIMAAGSLCLFAIFILILVYWADILKKYFYPGARRSRPMRIFFTFVAALAAAELLNDLLFLFRAYSSEALILYNAILLAIVSIVCVVKISIFSHRFRTVLKTLGAINQVNTDSQIERIVWITATGDLFFFARAFLETLFAIVLIVHWHKTGTVACAFSRPIWNTFVILKYWSEIAILGLMLYILQSRFASAASSVAAEAGVSGGDGDGVNRGDYQAVPDASAEGMSGGGAEPTNGGNTTSVIV